jgi:hypothetical protein
MSIKRPLKSLAFGLAALVVASATHAAGFVNGGFEDGNTNGWTVGGGSRNGVDIAQLNPSAYLPGGSLYNATIANTHSAVVSPGADPSPGFGALMPNIVYGGNSAFRLEDRTTGGYVSVISQTVTNYTDSDIFFTWLAVLENGGHSAEQSAVMIIELRDLTANNVLISRVYNAVGGGGGVDSRFATFGNFYYTPQWQIEQLSIDASLSGHDFRLTVLASDCAPTGHEGYLYLDGFGAVNPPPGGTVPEPGTLALAGAALLGMVGMRRRKQA